VPGWAGFYNRSLDVIAPACLDNVKHNKARHEHLVFLTVVTERVPHWPCEKQMDVRRINKSVYRSLFTLDQIRYAYKDAM
jgi:KUP system potassium uptake protein